MSGKTDSRRVSPEQEAMVTAGVIGLLAFSALILFIKYLPVVILAIPLGWVLCDGMRARTWTKKIKFTAGNLVLLTTSFLLLFAIPWKSSDGYYGILKAEWLIDLLWWASMKHNALIDKVSLGGKFFQKAKITELTYLDTSQYLWSLLAIAVGWSFVFLLMAHFKQKETRFLGVGSASFVAMKKLLGVIQWPVRKMLAHPFEVGQAVGVWFALLGALMAMDNALGPAAVDLTDKSPLFVIGAIIRLLFVFYSLVMTFLLLRAVCLRVKLICHLVPLVDWVLGPLYGLLSIQINGQRKRPQGAVALGKDINTREEVLLTEKNLNYHTQVVGGSGAGKTNLIKNVISDKVFGGDGILFLDLKADFDTVEWIAKAAQGAGRIEELKLFSLTHQELSLCYNPMRRGTATELHSKLMNAMTWSEEFYRKTASHALSDALMVLCEVRDRTGEPFYIRDVYRAVSSSEALAEYFERSRQSAIDYEAIEKRIARLKTKEGQMEVKGLSTDLLNLTRSSAGSLIGPSERPEIDLFEAISSGEIVYFLLDSMSEKESSEMLGRLLLQDLITTTGLIYNRIPEEQRRKTQVIIDEFAAFATPNFIDFINRARGAGVGIMVAHQSRGDLREVSENFCDRLERNCGTKLIFGTDNDEDAEYFASMVGTKKTMKDTFQMEEGFFSTQSTGMMSRREVDEFLIHPNVIKSLGQGEILRISRLVDTSVNLTKIYLAEEFEKIEPRLPFYEDPAAFDSETSEADDFKDVATKPEVTNKPLPPSGEVFV